MLVESYFELAITAHDDQGYFRNQIPYMHLHLRNKDFLGTPPSLLPSINGNLERLQGA